MDYARKIGKSEEPRKWSKKLPQSIRVFDRTFYKEDIVYPEDRPLVNWKKWLANRKKQYKHIESFTGRHRTDQVLNTSETVRSFVEMRNLMDYATVPAPVIPDKFRGGPEFWRTPETLSNHGDPCLPIVAITPSKKELNVLPELMYVDLPELMEKEKDLVGLKSKEPLWKRSQYLMKRKIELSKEIALLVPKEPETRHLVIHGQSPRLKVKAKRIPPITISDDLLEKDEEEDQRDPEELQDQAIVLRIQDREIIGPRSAFEYGKSDPITWNVSFSARVNRRTEKEIELENKGNRVIIYEWRNGASGPTTIRMKRRLSPFYFNKTKGVIPPGQIVKLQFWYRPRTLGVFSELWRFKTDPDLCPSPLIFRLSGCAESPANILTYDLVDEYLDHCIRDTTIREVINEIMEDMYSVQIPGPCYGSLFLESEIFLAKNPLCFYHPSIITEFHKIYYSATNQKELRWNLCVEDLRQTLLTIKQPELRHPMLLQFSQLYKECLKPSLCVPSQYTKHEMVYNLLCSFFNRFEFESEYAKTACFMKQSTESVLVGPEINNIKPTAFQGSVRSNISRNKRGRNSSSRVPIIQVHETSKKSYTVTNDRPYKEIFFIRIYEFFDTTVERVFATIDSFNNLNELDK
ncbi:MYCBP-associated protein [Dufourea novaeangliae]|uniref:MYCBP-associated protein n=1 Tax=Dufourea novaeangliae TaxID=178035 RepID=A0A154PKW0_DUFNO|nr:MYCBP-associated protein [Dufourea novaeangliae]